MAEAIGRWDLTVVEGNGSFPSWVEFDGTGGGQFVGRVGSARPLRLVEIDGDRVKWALPPQYEGRKDELVFEGSLAGGVLSGTTMLDNGTPTTWTGKRAPDFAGRTGTTAEQPVELVGGDLSNWVPRSPDWESHWSIVEGVLTNGAVGSDLVTVDRFADFHLLAEYRYPKGSNSGIYLRGRYEFQILDDFGGTPSVGSSGAIYGFLTPTAHPIHEAGQWNTAEITLIGRTVTVKLNGSTIHDGLEIPGITGGALDSDEAEPGPLFVQGDHGPVEFRRLTLTPLS